MTIKEVLEKWKEILIGVVLVGCGDEVARELDILKRVFRAKYKKKLRSSKKIEKFLEKYGKEIVDPEIEKRIISLYRLI